MKKKELIKKLRPFWHRHLKLREEFSRKERKLEEEMNKKLKLDTELEFLENYRWSSFLDYIGKKNFPSVTQREFLNEFFEGPKQYKKRYFKMVKRNRFRQRRNKKVNSGIIIDLRSQLD